MSQPASDATRDEKSERLATHQKVGRVLGPLVFVAMLLLGAGQEAMPDVAWRTAAVALWMAIWWATEAIPVPVTAMLPLVVFAPAGIATMREAAAPYANPIIYLFLGGFIMALAVERWNLHRRIALMILDKAGTDGRRLIGGFMVVCALLSMWMTNTSTTMMLLPIVLSVASTIREHVEQVEEENFRNFEIALLLGLAYAASIGGLATLIGTPPNAFLVGFLAENNGIEISFARWMAVGIPVSAVMLPIAWLALTRVLYPVHIHRSAAVDHHLHELRGQLGPMTKPEKRVAAVFGLVIACWMLRRPLTEALGITGFTDAGIVMAGAVALFLLPSGSRRAPNLMTWPEVYRLPWGVLLLFGGGLSLAAAVSGSGLALWLGQSLAPLNAFGLAVLVVAAVALVIFLTELTSNLATTATLLPVMAAIALEAGLPPLTLTVPVTIAASCAFMLPVATPPNAIVFATWRVTIGEMVRAGLLLNVLGVIIVTLAGLYAAPALLQ